MNLKASGSRSWPKTCTRKWSYGCRTTRMKEEGAEVKVVGAGGAQSTPRSTAIQSRLMSRPTRDRRRIRRGGRAGRYAPDMMRRHDAMVSWSGTPPSRAGWSRPSAMRVMLASAGVVKGRKLLLLFH